MFGCIAWVEVKAGLRGQGEGPSLLHQEQGISLASEVAPVQGMKAEVPAFAGGPDLKVGHPQEMATPVPEAARNSL